MANNVSLTISSILTVGVEISLCIYNVTDTKVNMMVTFTNVTICPFAVVTGRIILLKLRCWMLPGHIKHGKRKLRLTSVRPYLLGTCMEFN